MSETRSRLQASLGLWLVTVAAGVVIGHAWLQEPAVDLAMRVRLFLPLALVSSVAIWALIPAAWMAACHLTLRRRRASGILQAFAGALFLVFLYTDTIVFRLLGHHWNGAVWNVLKTPGSGDAVHLGLGVWGPVVFTTGLLTAAGYGLWSFLLKRSEPGAHPLHRTWRRLRPIPLAAALLTCVVFVEKGVYAAADVARDHDLRAACRALPLYPRIRLTPSSTLSDGFEILRDDLVLDYPRAPLEMPASAPRPNIVVLVIDSWRRDMFDPELTPYLWEFSRGARVFQDHLSGGNGTRFGLFSLLYGLHGAYWFPVLEERQPPVLLQVLGDLGYELRVFSSASMSFPEFDRTAWAHLDPQQVHDDYPGRHADERDRELAADFAGWIEARERERPFFAFLLLDSAHQPYSNDGGPHRPAAEGLDYIELATTTGPDLVERVFNRYKNAVMHADRVAGVLVDALDAVPGRDDTILIVTGDHGEEFQECGFWGHTSNFSPQQIDVPFLMRGPGIPVGVETLQTSHLDVSATLLELLGADPARRSDHSLGENLLAPPRERERVVAGWSALGLVSRDDVVYLPLERGEVEFYDHDWRPLADVEERWRGRADEIVRLRRECSAFLRPEGR